VANSYLVLSFALCAVSFSMASTASWRRAFKAADAAAGEIFASGDPVSTDSSFSEFT